MRSFRSEISIRADLDQDIYGFSVSLNFDPNDITITSVRLGSAVRSVSEGR